MRMGQPHAARLAPLGANFTLTLRLLPLQAYATIMTRSRFVEAAIKAAKDAVPLEKGGAVAGPFDALPSTLIAALAAFLPFPDR
jgi:hypothetical protein